MSVLNLELTFTTTADLRAYHPIYKDKNSMAYRVLLNYSHKNTPANQMMSVEMV